MRLRARRPRSTAKRSTDRRVQRTRSLLHEALLRLIREREYHRISVSQILARANIGRSTFYTHFRNKEALFASALQEILESVSAAGAPAASRPMERIIGFGLQFFEHIERHRRAGVPHVGHRSRAILHQHVCRILASWIAGKMDREGTSRLDTAGLPKELLARYVASTFVLVLDWWIEHKFALSSTEANALFRSLVLPALGPSSSLERVRPRWPRGGQR